MNETTFFQKTLESLPAIASNPLTVIVFLATLAAWFLIWYRTRRLGLLLSRLEQVPTPKRPDLIKAEMGVVLPEKISAEQWIRSRKHQYFLVGFLALCFLVLSIVGIAAWRVAGIERGKKEIEALQRKSEEAIERIGHLSFDNEKRTEQLKATQSGTEELKKLTSEMQDQVQKLKQQAATGKLSKDIELRLSRAEGAIQFNRGLIYLMQGKTDNSIHEFSQAIARYESLSEAEGDRELVKALGRGLYTRALAFHLSQRSEEAQEDLRKASDVYERVQPEDPSVSGQLAKIRSGLEAVRGKVSDPSVPGVMFEPSLFTAIVVQKLPDPNAIKEVHVVKAGTKLSGHYYPEHSTTELGKPMLVERGEYDVVCKTPGGGSFVLAKGIVLKEQQTARVNTSALVGTIVVEQLTLEGFPEIKEVTVFEAGTTGYRLIHQRTQELGTALPIAPGSYDVHGSALGAEFVLKKNVEIRPREILRIETDREVAAIVVRDPKIEGLELKAIYVLKAGTNAIAAQSDGFGKPIMVYAGDSYDVALEQPSGRMKLKTGLTPKRGEHTYIP